MDRRIDRLWPSEISTHSRMRQPRGELSRGAKAASALLSVPPAGASFGLYNTREEVDGLAQALIKAQGFFA
jgi:selenocysteine lyase/cysteine desulfurase